MKETPEYTEVPVTIPNFDGTGVATRLMVEVPIRRDPNTGEELMTDEAFQLIEQAKRHYMKLLSPKEIRKRRKGMGMTQGELSTLIQVGKKNFSRWESGRSPISRLVNVVLHAVYDGVLTPAYLRTLQPGLVPAEPARTAKSCSREAKTAAVAPRPDASLWEGITRRETRWKEEGPVSLLDATCGSFGRLIPVKSPGGFPGAAERAELVCSS